MKMGDRIMFRGRRRFVIGVRPGGLVLKRVRPGKCMSACVYYSVGSAEKEALMVIEPSTAYFRARARALLEAECQPWTTIVWDGDEPTYVHDTAKFPGRFA